MPWEQYKKIVKGVNDSDLVNVLYRSGTVPIDEIVEAIHEAYKKGNRFIVLDHLHYFVEADEMERLHLVQAMKKLKGLTKIYSDIMIFLVVHPSNPSKDMRTGKPQRFSMYNSKGCSDIYQECDNFWVLNKDEDLNVVDLTVDKLRSDKTAVVRGGNVKIYFDKTKFSFTFV
jgi:hypothetical protein